MENKGFIALHRKFLDWQWFSDINTCHLFLYCLLRANYKNTEWHGINIKKGQFVTSLRTISSDTGMSLQQVRTSLKKLTQGLTHELTHESHSQYSIITVKNYSQYQNINTQNNTNFNKQITTDNKRNNIRYINTSSSSSIENLPKISEEEEELLKSHSIKNNIRYFHPWLRKVLINGDYKEILKKEKERLRRLDSKEDFSPRRPIITDEERKQAEEYRMQLAEKVKKTGRFR